MYLLSIYLLSIIGTNHEPGLGGCFKLKGEWQILQNEVTKQYESISFQIVKTNYKAKDGKD